MRVSCLELVSFDDIHQYTSLSYGTLRRIRKRIWVLLRLRNERMFNVEGDRLGTAGNVVEIDESRFKRHANVGRMLRAGWFFGLTERLTQD